VRKIALAFSFAIACGHLGSSPSQAADFSQAKRTYVPPTAFDRRVDFTTMRDYQAVSSSVPAASRGSTKYSVAPRSSSTGSGIVPPPPPYPSSLAQTAKSVHNSVRKATASPQVQAALTTMKQKAAELAKSGKFDEAKQVAARALQMSPHDKAVLRGMALSSLERAKQFVATADIDKGLQYAREALAYDGTNVEAQKMVEGLLLKSGSNPSSAEERLKNAELLLSQGRNDEAYVEYQAAAKLKPSAEAHVGIGNIALRSGQKERAKTEYHQALEVDPNSSLAYRQLGLLKLGNGDVVGANAALSRALVLNPKDKHASKSLIELWQQQVSKVPGANSHLGLARAYQLAGDLQSAQTQYRHVVRLDPENPHLPAARQAFKLALARQDAERSVEAARTLESAGAVQDAYQKAHDAVRLAPGDADYRVYQGDLLAKLSRYSPAREAYLNALKINPRHSLAAERLKALPPDTVTLAPELAAPPSQTFVAPAVGAASNGLAAASGVPAAVTHDPVQNISNFAFALRNQMVVNKAQMEQVEDSTRKALTALGTSATTTETVATPATAPVTAGGAAEAAADPGGLSAQVDEALASASKALAAAKGLVGKGSTPAPAASAAPTAAAPAAEAATAASTITDPLSAFPKVNNAWKQMQTLRDQNKALQAQLKKMNDSMAKMRGQAAPIPEPAAAPAATATQTSTSFASAPVDAAFEPPVAPPIAQTIAEQNAVAAAVPQATTAMQLAQIPAGMQARTPEIDPNVYAPAPAPQLRQAVPIPQLIRLELENASPKVDAVELSVILRNDGDMPLPLATNKMRAVINYSNRRPAEVKAMFNDAAVPPHGAIRGTIKVPFDKVDPTADLVIPDLLPAGTMQRDVHLITSMAYR
jgi:tetratricopeptide (TPR) repeat protein